MEPKFWKSDSTVLCKIVWGF